MNVTDADVEAAVAVLAERGWERDDEMVGDVRAALDAVAALQAPPPATTRDRSERARRLAEQRREARWRYVAAEVRPE